MRDYQHGWYQVAFESDLTEPLTPLYIGTRALVVAKTPQGLRTFDAACPHRGAHLAYGGRLDRNNTVVCPFHGFRIGLGRCGITSDRGFFVREYATLNLGGLVFVRLSDSHDNGFTALLRQMQATHQFVPGFTMTLKTSPEMVIENGYDAQHFKTVHGVYNQPELGLKPSEAGELRAEGFFEYPRWDEQARGTTELQRVAFIAQAISPGLIISTLQSPESPYTVITGASPTPTHDECRIWVSVALPVVHEGDRADSCLSDMLIARSLEGIQKDQIIWEHLVPGAPSRLTPRDGAIVQFQQFCQPFYA